MSSAFVLAFLAGCVTVATTPEQNPWIGHAQQELLIQYGPPTSSFDDGAGGRILTYSQSGTLTVPGRKPALQWDPKSRTWVEVPGSGTAPTSITTGSATHFYVGADGKIYAVRTVRN